MEETNKRDSAGQSEDQQTEKLLHPRIYAMMTGLAGWLVLSVWMFSGAGSTDYLLTIVSGFIFIAVALPFILSRLRRDGNEVTSLRTWGSLAISIPGRDDCGDRRRRPRSCCRSPLWPLA